MRADDRRRASCASCRSAPARVNDVVSWLCAAAAFFAMAHAFKHGDFVRVTLLLEKAARRRRSGASRSPRWRSPRSPSATSPGGRTASPGRAASSTTSRRACCRCRCGSRSSTFAIGAILLFVAVVDELVVVAARRPAELRRRGRGAARARRLLRRRLSPPATHGHPRRRRASCSCLMLVLLAGGVWIAMTLAICGWVGQAFFTTTQPGKNLFSAFWEIERVVGAGGAAAVHLDGRDPVSHPALARRCSKASRRG